MWMREEAGLPGLELICLLAISSCTLLQGPRMDLLLIQGRTIALKEDFHACQAVHTQICYQEGPEDMTSKGRGTQGGHGEPHVSHQAVAGRHSRSWRSQAERLALGRRGGAEL